MTTLGVRGGLTGMVDWHVLVCRGLMGMVDWPVLVGGIHGEAIIRAVGATGIGTCGRGWLISVGKFGT